MASQSEDEGGLISAINVTPLVDIILVLLIIFMLTATIIATPAIKVDLPKAASGDKQEVTLLGITITADRIIYLNEKQVDQTQLFAQMQQTASMQNDAQALIAADKSIPYGEVVNIIDLVKRAGITRFALNINISKK